jgi:hypothetical protein
MHKSHWPIRKCQTAASRKIQYYLRYFGTVHYPNEIDIRKGLAFREQWILDRNDVEEAARYHLIMERGLHDEKI